jgi:hypothetical protein
MNMRNDAETQPSHGQFQSRSPRGVRSPKNHGTEHSIMEVLR